MKIESRINGVNFQCVSDVIIDRETIHSPQTIKNRDVIWCQTDHLDVLLQNLKYRAKVNPATAGDSYVLITHGSDHDINEERFNSRPPCIKKWFAQNANYQHEDLIPVPIGIENHFGPYKGTCIDIEFLNNHRRVFQGDRTNKVYYNANHTHWNRVNVEKILQDNSFVVFGENKPSADYHRDLESFVYTASPRGNGIDCHRTWEALYMRSIPIVERHFMYDSWKNLPIIQIDRWEDVTEEFLKQQSATFGDVYANELSPMLRMDYWHKQVKLEKAKL